MAIVTARTLPEVTRLCAQLGLTPGCRGKKQDKTDFVLCLREHFLQKKYPTGTPRGLELMLQIESPMLCYWFDKLKPEEQEELWTSPDWYLEDKIDGDRMLITFFPEDGDFLHEIDFFSRNNSVDDFLPISYAEKILLPDVDWSALPHSFILDSEIVCTTPQISTIMGKRGVVTETMLNAVSALLQLNAQQSRQIQREAPLKFFGFDLLYWDGEWVTDLPLRVRRNKMVSLVRSLRDAGFPISLPRTAHNHHSTNRDKQQFFEDVIAGGGEGVVAKNLNAPYNATTGRPRGVQVKIKRSAAGTLQRAGVQDTIDAYVTGFKPGTPGKGHEDAVGALEFSVLLEQQPVLGEEDWEDTPQVHVLAYVSGIPDELRQACTVVGEDGKPALHPDYYGRVAALDGQDVSARNLRLMHARIIRWRPDRSSDTCLISMEHLKSMVL